MKGAVQHDIWKVLFDVENEFHAARDKHGDNDHLADITFGWGRPNERLVTAKTYQKWNDDGFAGWDTVLMEEVLEALESTSNEDRYNELIQVAAMACGWALAIKQRVAGSPPAVEASERAAGERTTTT